MVGLLPVAFLSLHKCAIIWCWNSVLGFVPVSTACSVRRRKPLVLPWRVLSSAMRSEAVLRLWLDFSCYRRLWNPGGGRWIHFLKRKKTKTKRDNELHQKHQHRARTWTSKLFWGSSIWNQIKMPCAVPGQHSRWGCSGGRGTHRQKNLSGSLTSPSPKHSSPSLQHLCLRHCQGSWLLGSMGFVLRTWGKPSRDEFQSSSTLKDF